MMSVATTKSVGTLPPLRDAHAALRLSVYLQELWDRRVYIGHTALSELRHRQITNVLGNLWHLLNPTLTIAIYYVIFGLLLDVTRGVEDGQFLLFLTVGLFTFQFTQKCATYGAKAVTSNRGVIRAVRFPRALLPITSTTTEFLATLPNYLVLVVVATLSGVAPTGRWAWLVPFVAIQLLFNLGVSFFVARLGVHFADTSQLLPFIFRLLLYASGVIFSVEGYADGDQTLELLFTLNPLYCFITLARWAVMGGAFDPALLLSASMWSVALLLLGFWWFRAGEDLYARD